jgi:hypothetical protein
MRRSLAVIFALVVSSAAYAEEPVGCDKFKWPIEQDRAALTASTISQLQSGAALGAPPAAAIVGLQPLGDANLPKTPERNPKPETFAGFVTLAAVPAGTYTVSLSEGGWVDAVQNGAHLKPKAFSGATGCDGIRKVMKYELTAAPLTIQISGVMRNTVRLAIQPVSN